MQFQKDKPILRTYRTVRKHHKFVRPFRLFFGHENNSKNTSRSLFDFCSFVLLDKEYEQFCPNIKKHLDRPLRLKKCLHGAGFSGKSWYETLDEFLTKELKFTKSKLRMIIENMYECMYVCMYVHICVCTFIHTYINTLIHILYYCT